APTMYADVGVTHTLNDIESFSGDHHPQPFLFPSFFPGDPNPTWQTPAVIEASLNFTERPSVRACVPAGASTSWMPVMTGKNSISISTRSSKLWSTRSARTKTTTDCFLGGQGTALRSGRSHMVARGARRLAFAPRNLVLAFLPRYFGLSDLSYFKLCLLRTLLPGSP